MAKASKKKPEKKRAEKYEPKVSFDGTFEDMIGLSVKDAESPVKNQHSMKDTVINNIPLRFQRKNDQWMIFIGNDIRPFFMDYQNLEKWHFVNSATPPELKAIEGDISNYIEQGGK